MCEGAGGGESRAPTKKGPRPKAGAPIPTGSGASRQSLRRRVPLSRGALRGADWGAGALRVLGALWARGAL